MKIAVLGAGRIGSAHVATLAALPSVSQIIVADLDRSRAEAAAAAHDLASPATIDEAFDSGPDGIVVATPTSTHAQLVRRAVAAGMPTFCEKPLAESLDATIELVAELEATDVPVQIGFQRRFDLGYAAVRTALRDGTIGEARRIHMLTCDPTPPPAGYIPTSGGIFRDCHIHDFDVLRWVTGVEVASVFAVGANRGEAYFAEAGDVDESAALLTLVDGTLVTLQGSRCNGAGYDVRLELHGTRATWVAGLDRRSPLTNGEPDVTFPDLPAWPDFPTRFATAYAAELAEFVAVAEGRVANPCTPRDALQALRIAEAADRSRHESRSVALTEIPEARS